MVRLTTGHSRLGHHVSTQFYIGEASASRWSTLTMTVKYALLDRQTYRYLRVENWSARTPTGEGEGLDPSGEPPTYSGGVGASCRRPCFSN